MQRFNLKNRLKNKCKGSVALIMSAALLVSSCSPNEFIKQQLAQTDVIKEIIRDKTFSARMKDKIMQRHLRASDNTEFEKMNRNHIKSFVKGTKNNLSMGGGQASTTLVNGNMVANFDAWIQPNKFSSSERIMYFIFKFYDENTLESGQINMADGSSAYTSEVWRYFNNTWCVVVPKIDIHINTATVIENTYDMNTNTASLRVLTGSNDGVVGEIAFKDTNPMDTTCSMVNKFTGKNTILPYTNDNNPYDTSFYKPMRLKSGYGPVVSSHGSIQGLRLVDVYSYQNNKYQPNGEKIFIAWSSTYCMANLEPDSVTGCEDEQLFDGDVFIGEMGQGLGSVAWTETLFGGYHELSNFDKPIASAANSVDLFFYSVPEEENSLIRFKGAATFAQNNVAPLVFYGKLQYNNDKDKTKSFSLSNRIYIKPTDISKDNFSIYQNVSVDLESAPPFKTGTESSISFKAQAYNAPVATKNSASVYNYNLGNLSCSVNDKQVFCNTDLASALAKPYLTPLFKMLNINLVNYNKQDIKLNSATIDNYYGNQSLSRTEDNSYSLVRASAVPGEVSLAGTTTGVRAFVAKNNSNTTDLRFLLERYYSMNITSGEAALMPAAPQDLAGLDSYYLYTDKPGVTNTQIFTADIKDFKVAKLRHPDQKSKIHYFYGRTTDKPDVALSNNSHRTKGGVFLCVARGSGNDYNEALLKDCEQVRPDSATDLTFGSSYATAKDIFGEGNDSTTPLRLTHSYSPEGVVFLNYFAANGGIFTINATAASGNNFKNWSRIKTGKTTSCMQTYSEAAAKVNKVEKKSFWGKMLMTAAQIGFSLVMDTLEPLGPVLGAEIEIITAGIENSADNEEVDEINKKFEFADGSSLQTKCGI